MKRKIYSLPNLLFAVFSLLLLMMGTNLSAQTIPVAEPAAANNTAATATPIAATPVKLRGNIYPANDIDFYSFSATAGSKVYIALMTAFSSGSTLGSGDSQVTLIGPDGTTVIEFDDDNGSFGTLSSSIAGATIPTTGTYYIKVNDFDVDDHERGYDLYVKVQTGSPTAEAESNDTPATANTVPASGWISGSRNPAAATEQDWFSITLAAGESVFLSLDCDPERDGTSWNGRLGFALFGDASNQILVVDDAGTADAGTQIPSEAMFFTAKDAGTYFVFVDASSAAVGGPTSTYNLSVTKFAAAAGYTTYTSTAVPVTIGPANNSVTSTLTVPDSRIIKDVSVRVTLNHALMQDVDATLTAPNGSIIHLFSDIGASAVGGQTQMDIFFNDNNGIPPAFTVLKGVGVQPEAASKLDQLKGTNSAGTWTLTLYDDGNNASGGTLTSWGLSILEEVSPVPGSHVLRVNEDFEATDGAFTHSGTADEFEWGTPATAATTTTNPVAAFTTANSGTKAWKTDLDGTYNVSSSQTLESPTYNFSTVSGSIFVNWAMKYQMESANFDQLVVYVEEVGGAGTVIPLFTWMGATQTASIGNPTLNIPMSSGWGSYFGDISAMAGKQFRFKVRLISDNTVNFGGVAIDDLKIYAAPCNISSVAVSNQGSCSDNGTPLDATDDFYTADVTVTYTNPPTTGNLQLEQSGAVLDVVTIAVGSLVGTSHTFTGVRLKANGLANPIEAEFTVGTCVRTIAAPTVAPCSSIPCTLTCPANITVSNDANQCGAVVTFPAPGTSGSCGTVTATPASGSFFPKGTTTVNVISTSGATCSFTVTVNDTQNPTITCPANIVTATAANQCSAVVNFTPTVSDNCPGATFVATPASGSTFPKGVTTVNVVATDAAGRTSNCSFTVTVNDTQNPTVTCPANITLPTTGALCTRAVTFTPTASDNCPGVTISSVPASGSNFPIGATVVTVTATDAANRTATCTFTVTITDSQAPGITAANQPINDTVCASGTASFTVVATNAVSYQWQVNTGSGFTNIAGATAATLTIPNVTLAMHNYQYHVVVTGTCSSITSSNATLKVNPLPVVSILASPFTSLQPNQLTTLYATFTGTPGTFNWYNGATLVQTTTAPLLPNVGVDGLGTYRLVFTDINGCSGTSNNVALTANQNFEFWVYPVPNDGRFLVRFYSFTLGVKRTLRVWDAKGSVVFEKEFTMNSNYERMDVDISKNTAGTYYVELRDASGPLGTGKVLVLK